MDAAPTTSARDAALAFLLGRINYERLTNFPYSALEFKLDRMHVLLRRLGDPHVGRAVVHVTGTKGKGSTSAMIAAVVSAAGYRVGLFSSPHLERIEERFVVDGLPCSEEELIQLIERVRPVAEEMDREAAVDPERRGPTYFELTTAMAWLHFAARNVDLAVLEVGLGGRLDATNVCQPLVCAITSISFDHTRQLGDTLAEIAAEKSGIIKPGVPVVSGVVADEPRDVIVAAARARGAVLRELGADFQATYEPPRHLEREPAPGWIEYRAADRDQATAPRRYALGLPGRRQADNAAVALAAIDELRRLGWRVPEAAIRDGLAHVRWPARIEVAARRPTVVLDAAHNVASVEALIETLAESFSARRRVLIFATTRDKDVAGMLRALWPWFDEILLTRYALNPRAAPLADLAAAAEPLTAAHPATAWRVVSESAAAWEAARASAGDGDLICVTGSFFIAAEMRRFISAAPIPARP